MELADCFPVWDRLSAEQQRTLTEAAVQRSVPKGTLLHSGADDCVGLLAIASGRLRAFILSDEGKEVTIYRLFERDICLFSASCMINDIQFDITIEAERNTTLWVIPPDVYKRLMESSLEISNFTNQLIAARFTDVMWLVEQILWKSVDKRLAAFLLEEYALDNDSTLNITQERIAAHIGTAREVVTRMLKYFQTENIVRLMRGKIILEDFEKLAAIAE